MIDVNRWFSSVAGLPDQEEESPVQKALKLLNPNAGAAPPPATPAPAGVSSAPAGAPPAAPWEGQPWQASAGDMQRVALAGDTPPPPWAGDTMDDRNRPPRGVYTDAEGVDTTNTTIRYPGTENGQQPAPGRVVPMAPLPDDAMYRAQMGGEQAMMGPGDGGFAPTPEYDPRDADSGPREWQPPAPVYADPTVSDPTYNQDPNAAPAVDPLDPSTWGASSLPPTSTGPRFMPPQEPYRDPREGQGIVARGIDALGQMLPSAPIVDTKPGDARVFMGEQPASVGQLWEWRGRVAEGAADALSRGTGQDPDALVLNVEIGGLPIKMTVSELLENVTDPLLAVGWGVGDMVLDAAGKAVLRLVAPYAKGAARETIGRLLNAEPIRAAARAGVEAVREGADALGRGLQGVGREVAGGLMDLSPGMAPRMAGDAGPGIGRALADGPNPSQSLAQSGPNPKPAWQMALDEWAAEMARVSPDGSMPDPQVDNAAYRRWYELNANKPVSETPTVQSGPFETDSRLRPAIESSYLRPDDYRFVGRIDVTPRSALAAEAQTRVRAGLSTNSGGGLAPRAKFERDGRMTFQGEILDDPRAGRTMTHEVGHSIENNLPESLLERWKSEIHPDTKDPFEYGRHLQNGGEAPPTPYAAENWAEDFAETFTEWRQAQAEGRAPNLGPLRQRFMQDVDAWLSGGRSLERGTMDGQRFEQPRLLSTGGVSPGGVARDIWARAATDVGNSAGGGVGGAFLGYGAPADSEEERRQNALRGAGIGMVVGPLAGRAMRRAGGALATPGVGPNGRPSRPTVEVLQQELDGMRATITRARAEGNTDLERRAIDRAWELESALVDARNARRDLEPALASDVGRRMDELPLDERSADDYAGLGRERVAPSDAADLGGPASVVPDRFGRANSALPFDPASAALGAGAGAASEDEDGGQGDPLRAALGFLIAGVGGGMSPGARRALSDAMKKADALKAAGRADEVAAVVNRALHDAAGFDPRLSREPVLPGMEPPRRVPGDAGPSISDAANRGPVLGDVPPSAVNQGALPGMDPLRNAPAPGPVDQFEIPDSLNTPRLQSALSAAERRAENMQRRGLTTPSVWDWIKQAGYAGIYGPATAMSSTVGGATELLLGQPKEAVRALVSGRPGSYGAQVRAQIQAMPEGLEGLGRILTGAGSEGAAAASGGSQGTANLSERVVNPVGHFVARMLERPGEILTEAPDAVFRPLFTAQGMQREAHAIASEAGLRGRQALAYADELMQAAQELRLNPNTAVASEAAHRIVDAGGKYADEVGYKGKPGGFGQWLGNLSKRDDAVGVAASFLMPFPAMAARMSEAAVNITPGVGAVTGVLRGRPKFDVIYDQALGTALAGGVTYWAFNGGITGSGPSDPEKRQMMIDQGWQPNSTLVGGYYVPNRVFGRFQAMLDTAGEIHDALAYGKKDANTGEMAADLVKRGSRIATDQTGLSGLADLHDMLTQGFASQFPGWAARSATRYFPYAGVIRATAAGTDTVQRKPEKWADVGLGEAVMQQGSMAVPGLRQRLPSAQTSLGQDAPNPQQGLGAIIPRTTIVKDDPTIRVFQAAGVDIPRPSDSFSIRNMVPENQRPAGSPSSFSVALTPAEQRQWNTTRGQELIRQTGILQARAGWSAKPVAQQQVDLKLALQAANDKADAEMQKQLGTRTVNERIKSGLQKKAS